MNGQLFNLDLQLGLLDGFYPRLMAQIDRDPDSPTYGSADRGMWMYRLHDFDSGVLLQSSLTLAALAKLGESGRLGKLQTLGAVPPEYFKRLALAVNRRNLTAFGKNGMADEYYPGEQSFVATAFAAYATLKSALLLGQDEITHSPVLEAAAEKLVKRKPSPPANQDTAAASFLNLYSSALSWRTEETRQTLTGLLEREAYQGEFLEYGGGDLGYASVALNYLGYMLADGGIPVERQLLALGEKLSVFVSPSGRLGGEYASRSTTYFTPFGFLQAAARDARLAGVFANLDFASIYSKLDDRYLFHYCLPALAMSALHLVEKGQPPKITPASRPSDWQTAVYFNGSLAAMRRGDACVFVGLNKGGAFQVERGADTTMDCGYRAARGGKVYATCVVGEVNQSRVASADGKYIVEITAPFLRYGHLTPSPLKTIALRVVSFLGAFLNAFFKKILIKDAQTLPGVSLNRKIVLDQRRNVLVVEDHVNGLLPGDRLAFSPPSSFRVVPSAKFYMPGEEEAYLRAGEALQETRFQREFDLG